MLEIRRREEPGGNRSVWGEGVLFALFLALTLLSYRPVLSGWFIADDFRWLELSNGRSVLRSFVGPWGHGDVYRPIARVSFFLDFLVYDMRYPGWILTNLLLHSGNAFLAYVIAARVLHDRLRGRVIALLFCTSPISHEAVAWISGRTHLLAVFFLALAVVAMFQYEEQGSSLALMGAALAFALGLLSYESTIIGLVLIPARLLSRVREGAAVRRRAAAGVIALCVVACGYWLARRAALSGSPGRFSPGRTSLTLDDLTVVWNVLVAWPKLEWVLLAAAAAVLATSLRGTVRLVITSGLCVVLGLAPFMVLQTLGNRYFYGAQLGVAVFVGTAFLLVSRRGGKLRRLFGTAAIIVVTLFSVHQALAVARRMAGGWQDRSGDSATGARSLPSSAKPGQLLHLWSARVISQRPALHQLSRLDRPVHV